MTDDAHWFDAATATLFSFDGSGKFVDSSGAGPRRGFQNSDAFASWLHAYVESRLLSLGLSRFHVPDRPDGAPVWHTAGALRAPDSLLVLLCGSGRIFAGLWSAGVCAYHGLGAGSVLPCVAEARTRGMEVLVLNPNHPASALLPPEDREAFGMAVHTLRVFRERLVEGAAPRRVFVLCHSLGGDCAISVFERWPQWVMERVCAVAMTDAVVSPIADPPLADWCFAHCVNWVRSREPLNARIRDGPLCAERSAETDDHPLTTWRAFPFIWEFFDQMAAGATLPGRQEEEEECAENPTRGGGQND
jgi:hypothetical protein